MMRLFKGQVVKKLGLILALCIAAINCFPVNVLAEAGNAGEVTAAVVPAPNPTPITEGSGTESDPFLIRTADELAWMAQMVNGGNQTYMNGYYRLEKGVIKKSWYTSSSQ